MAPRPLPSPTQPPLPPEPPPSIATVLPTATPPSYRSALSSSSPLTKPSLTTSDINLLRKAHPHQALIPSQLAEEGAKTWHLTLIGKFLGRQVSPENATEALGAQWRPQQDWEVLPMNHGLLAFKFSSDLDYTKALMDGPWIVDDAVLALEPYQADFRPSTEFMPRVVLWVRLPDVPLCLWSSAALEIIASKAGRFIKIDEATNLLSKLRFARAAVEIDPSCPLIPGADVAVEGSTASYWQPFEYEHVHLYCRRCGMIGHRIHQCSSLLHQPSNIDPEYSSSPLPSTSSPMDSTSSQPGIVDVPPLAGPSPPPLIDEVRAPSAWVVNKRLPLRPNPQQSLPLHRSPLLAAASPAGGDPPIARASSGWPKIGSASGRVPVKGHVPKRAPSNKSVSLHHVSSSKLGLVGLASSSNPGILGLHPSTKSAAQVGDPTYGPMQVDSALMASPSHSKLVNIEAINADGLSVDHRVQNTLTSSIEHPASAHPRANVSSSPPPAPGPQGNVKFGGKSKKSKNSSKPYSSRDSETSPPDLATRKGKRIMGFDSPASAAKPVLHSSSGTLGKTPIPHSISVPGICRAGSAAADSLARGPVKSGLDAEQCAQVSHDLHGRVSSSCSSQLDLETQQLCQLYSENEDQLLARFHSTLTDPQPILSGACMDHIGFDDELNMSENSISDEDIPDVQSDPDLSEDPPSDLLIQALLNDGFSRGDLERRFGLLPQS